MNPPLSLAIFHSLIDKFGPNELVIYTDGAKNIPLRAVSFVIYCPSLNLPIAYNLHPNTSILTAELQAISEAIEIGSRSLELSFSILLVF